MWPLPCISRHRALARSMLTAPWRICPGQCVTPGRWVRGCSWNVTDDGRAGNRTAASDRHIGRETSAMPERTRARCSLVGNRPVRPGAQPAPSRSRTLRAGDGQGRCWPASARGDRQRRGRGRAVGPPLERVAGCSGHRGELPGARGTRLEPGDPLNVASARRSRRPGHAIRTEPAVARTAHVASRESEASEDPAVGRMRAAGHARRSDSCTRKRVHSGSDGCLVGVAVSGGTVAHVWSLARCGWSRQPQAARGAVRCGAWRSA